MFSHVMIGANDLEASKKFYDAILGVLGYEPGVFDEYGRVFYYTQKGILALTKPINGEAATPVMAPHSALPLEHQTSLMNGIK